ncbi:uncharacterized protein LOC106641773 [Copidosoma floridanum]|uniref:uncharacterized protein LOC106641773 n=1 Tax=Copidosoma floridanum TaxID=29053 RepID=UPI0006C99AD1|nr:uncharacterized protein LOC106641773 [Copidosoma floridanum]
MPCCSVQLCRNNNMNTKNTGIRYFRFPKDEHLLEEWKIFCNKDNINLKNARVCSIHFTQSCFQRKPEHLIVPGDKNIYVLRKDAKPTEKPIFQDERKRKITKNVVKQKELSPLKSQQIENVPITCLDLRDLNKDESLRSMHCPTVEDLRDDQPLEKNQVTNSSLTILNQQLQQTITKLNEQLVKQKRTEERRVKRKVQKMVHKILKPAFTEGQIKKLLYRQRKNVKWNLNDLSAALTLRNVSPKAYGYLKIKNMPLPALSTLRRFQKLTHRFSVDKSVETDTLPTNVSDHPSS